CLFLGLFLVLRPLLLDGVGFEERGEPVGPRLPLFAVPLQPPRGLLQRLRLEPAGAPLCTASAGYQPCALEHLEVSRDRWEADRERLVQLGHGGLTMRQAAEDGAPGGVGEGRERAAETVTDVQHCTSLFNEVVSYRGAKSSWQYPRRSGVPRRSVVGLELESGQAGEVPVTRRRGRRLPARPRPARRSWASAPSRYAGWRGRR